MVLAAACASAGQIGPGVAPGGPVDPGYPADPGQLAEVRAAALEAGQRSRPAQPSRLDFRWRAREPDFRDSGFGVARIEPPYRARLDLFLDNGETAAVAALVDDELRIPASLPSELVPPAPLLWAALGVFRPGLGVEMLQGTIERNTLEVEYRLPSGRRVRFRLRDGALVDAELLERGSAVQRVFVSGSGGGTAYPAEATYRNLAEYRELELRLESVEHVDAFPQDIWTPRGP